MYLLVLLLPIISSFIFLLFGNKLGYFGTTLLTFIISIINLTVSFFIFYEIVFCQNICWLELNLWFDLEYCLVFFGGFFDSLTAIMLVIIIFISTFVNFYSVGYMGSDPHIIRFLSYLFLFIFFMILLVVSDNLLQLFVGWEGVGLCSYLLINFWYTRIQANKSAIKAILINRIGDIGLVLGILFLLNFLKSVNFSVIFTIFPLFLVFYVNFLNFYFNISDIIAFFLFFGAMGKSAQLGLHIWLPDAMEGPTPVSALIHAATMVTAGVFLIIRCSPIYEFCPIILFIITIVGSLTAVFGATTALFQNDIKKVIAYSTCSQLGYMFLICGLSHYSVGLFHLFNHAFFKALLFLGAGSLIHSLDDEQDLRKMGGLRKVLPFSYSAILIGSLSLAGFPFLTGYYSKDSILELAFSMYSILGHFSFYMGLFSAIFTAIYSTRLIYLVFLTSTNSFKQIILKVREGSVFIFFPLVTLILCSIFFGFFFKDMFIGLGTPVLKDSIFILPMNYFMVEGEFLVWYIKILPTILVLVSIYITYFFLSCNKSYLLHLKINYKFIYTYFNKKWFFDKISIEIFSQYILTIFLISYYNFLDKGLFEIFGPREVVKKIDSFSLLYSLVHTGIVYHYFFISLFLFIFVCFLIFFNLYVLFFILLGFIVVKLYRV